MLAAVSPRAANLLLLQLPLTHPPSLQAANAAKNLGKRKSKTKKKKKP